MEQIALDWGFEPAFYSVTELTQAVRETLSGQFADVRVSGEISGTRIPASGHYYFTLKDQNAQLHCVCYKMTARYLKFKPRDGIAVLARGRIDVYEARGEVQLIVDSLEPQGHGALQLAFEQLKKKLAAEGLFEAARKRKLPAMPQRIGIVTSTTGAAIRDILNVLRRRSPGLHIRIFPAQVQGEGSAAQVIDGIEYFGRSGWPDVVILARGGGSIEDLWTFNEERVARAIAASPVPVISGVGHETDFTIADFVADLRAPTPSAAAELAVCTRESLDDRIEAARVKLRQSMRLNLAQLGRRFHKLEVDRSRLHRAIGRQMQRLDELEYRIRERWRSMFDRRRRRLQAAAARLAELDPRWKLARVRRRLDACEAAASQALKLHLSRARGDWARLDAHFRQLSPLAILDRGYAIVERDGAIVKSPEDAPVDSEIRVRLARGELRGRVLGG